MKKYTTYLLILSSLILSLSCNKNKTETPPEPAAPKLIFKFRFDSTQVRLGNTGQPVGIAAGHAAQHPVMNSMSSHYIELAPSANTLLGQGVILYRAPETYAGGDTAIDFEKSSFAGDNQVFYEVPLKDVKPGEYEWIRVSLAYQNADVKFKVDTTISSVVINKVFTGTLAGFIGFNTYIKNFTIKNQSIPVNASKKQGFWGFESTMDINGTSYPFASTGQAPAGATTVVNPLFATSPVPAGSCVVTAAFQPGKLKITGTETNDIIVELSFSTNNSFEWEDSYHADGQWEPSKGEKMTDMGIRGMIPTVK